MLVRLCHSFLRTSFWEAPTILFGLAHPKAQSSCLPPPKSSLDLRMPSGCWVRGGAGSAWVPKEAFTKRSRAGAASARKPQQMGKQELLVKFILNLAFWGVCVCVVCKNRKNNKKVGESDGKTNFSQPASSNPMAGAFPRSREGRPRGRRESDPGPAGACALATTWGGSAGIYTLAPSVRTARLTMFVFYGC